MNLLCQILLTRVNPNFFFCDFIKNNKPYVTQGITLVLTLAFYYTKYRSLHCCHNFSLNFKEERAFVNSLYDFAYLRFVVLAQIYF